MISGKLCIKFLLRGNFRNDIVVDDWFQHFRTLLEKEVNNDDIIDSTIDDDADADNENHTLNRPISEAEVLIALRKIKLRKAPGPNGIIGEIIGYSVTRLSTSL